MTENIIHFVLARLPGAPAGTRGISLFLVPKFLPKADGSAGERNGIRCGAIEHKMGIKANATCVMVAWIGGRQVAIPYDRKPRAAGESKYPLGKMIRFAADAITAFSVVPLMASMTVGWIMSRSKWRVRKRSRRWRC